MELYSKIKLVRKSMDVVYATPGAIAYHDAFVTLLGGTQEYKYADVYLKTHGKSRKIRMNFDKNEQRYVYYDNDNNTKLYFHKTVSKEYSDKAWINNYSQLGIQYYLDRYTKEEGINDYFFIAEIVNSDGDIQALVSLVEDSQYIHEMENQTSDEVKAEIKTKFYQRIKLAMRGYGILNSFTSSDAQQLFTLLSKGYTPYIMSQLLPKLTEADYNKFMQILEAKNKLVKDQIYEKAAEMRDIERDFIDTLLISKLRNKFVIQK